MSVRDRCGERHAGVHERLERVVELEAADALRTDLADARRSRREPRRLEVDDDEMRVLEEDVAAGRIREPDGRTAPREPGVTLDDVVEERPGERRRRVREREQRARGLVDGDGAAPRLDELDQAVGGVEASCMRCDGKRTYVRLPSHLEHPGGLRRTGPKPPG